MAEQSPGLIKAVQRIDRFTDTTGVWIAWLNLPLVLAVSYEVIARSLFDPRRLRGPPQGGGGGGGDPRLRAARAGRRRRNAAHRGHEDLRAGEGARWRGEGPAARGGADARAVGV